MGAWFSAMSLQLLSRFFEKRETVAHLSPKDRIKKYGYRSFIGGQNPERWYSIGRLQYFFLVSQGLDHSHSFLDLGCGALRLGQYLIPYLDENKYFGLEPEKLLVECGLFHEIDEKIVAIKKPRFAHNYDFNVEPLHEFDYAMANSIFTHMTQSDITRCFQRLLDKTNQNTKFFFTFFEGDSSTNQWVESHANRGWHYSFEELESFAHGWNLKYIGDWGHPNDQKIVEANPIN